MQISSFLVLFCVFSPTTPAVLSQAVWLKSEAVRILGEAARSAVPVANRRFNYARFLVTLEIFWRTAVIILDLESSLLWLDDIFEASGHVGPTRFIF